MCVRVRGLYVRSAAVDGEARARAAAEKVYHSTKFSSGRSTCTSTSSTSEACLYIECSKCTGSAGTFTLLYLENVR